MSYFNAIRQNVVAALLNTSSANLASGATFTGTGESTLGVNAIQIIFKATENCTVYVDQSGDNINWDVTDQYHYNVIKDNFSVTVQAVADWVRVRVTNNGANATTSLRLHTVLCPVVDALPRSLDSFGNLQTAIKGLHDHFGYEGQFTPIRDLKVCIPHKMVGTKFGAAIDTNFWTATNSGAASASGVTNGLATLASGTANSGYAQLRSVRTTRFSFTQPLQYRAGIRIPTVAVALNTRTWGAFTDSARVPQNGVYFSLSETGVLSVNCVSGGTPNTVSSGSFNGDVSVYTMDTNFHFYEIMYFTAGAWFFIDNVLIHKFTPSTSILYQTLDTPVNFTSVNTAAGVTSGVIECCNSAIVKLGQSENYPASRYVTGTTAATVLKAGSGLVHSLNISGVANNSVVTLWDNTAASGTTLWSSGTQGNNAVPYGVDFSVGIPFFTGLTISITGASSNVTVEFE